MNTLSASARRKLFRWVGWFFLINAILAFLVIFGYLPQFETLKNIPSVSGLSLVFANGYFVFSFLAQVSFYAFLGAVLCFFVAILLPWRWPALLLGIVFGSFLLIALAGDAVVFRLFHMHYIGIGWQVYKAKAFSEVIPLGIREQLIGLSVILAAFLFQSGVAYLVWRFLGERSYKGLVYVGGFIVSVWGFVYLSFGLASAGQVWPSNYRYAILRSGRLVPYLSQLYLAVVGNKKAVRFIELEGNKIPILGGVFKKKLNYPIKALICKTPKKPLNVVIIGVDTWRFTSMNAKVTPHIYQFSKQSLNFENHFSGGNCTGPGIFSLFYSLPPTYWSTFLKERRAPVLLDEFQHAGYQVRAFLSAQSNFPRFDKTIFVKIPSLKRYTQGSSSIARDRKITQEFVGFLKTHDNQKPFFTFLFYDAIHNYCEPENPKENPFQPAVDHCDRFSLDASTDPRPYLNLYNNKVHFVDKQIGLLLVTLKKQNLLKNTVIIITADHGEQMNDAGMGLWGHASSYSRYQLHVPMLVYWPRKMAQHIPFRTTHYEIAPTLLSDVLGCQNKSSDYAVGDSLFEPPAKPYFVAGSYGDYAILEGGRSFRIYPDGDFQIADSKGRRVFSQHVSQAVMKNTLEDLQRFFLSK